ncbi:MULTISPECIES: hypothetical protein [unclassified Shinella]|uniref:hypothetical protein n=1 Tax=unclassified Shinella TaxID=2643062 RepID=UPI001FE03A5C|nr:MULTISPECIES: hypothetical protein [unclassified Shinella]
MIYSVDEFADRYSLPLDEAADYHRRFGPDRDELDAFMATKAEADANRARLRRWKN